MIALDRSTTHDLERSLSSEWLETNGIGGFASSSIVGCNTRRYHGLLVAALNPPTARTVLLSKLEDELLVGDTRYQLSTNEYPGATHPEGYHLLDEFRLDPFPTFVFSAGGVRVEKTIFMPHGLNATAVRYRLLDPLLGAKLSLRPLIAGRDSHHLVRAGSAHVETELRGNGVICRLNWGPELHLRYEHGDFEPRPDWYYRFQYRRERERGLDFEEDLYCPGTITLPLTADGCWLVAAAGPVTPEPERWYEAESARRRALLGPRADARPEVQSLVLAADTFLVRRRQDLRDIIAGYPWFEAWGRDAMIALPGLCLALGRFDEARGVLLQYARASADGLLPNCFASPDDVPLYNSVDAALWFVNAAYLLAQQPGQRRFVSNRLLPVAREIIERFAAGTRFSIHMDQDGLIDIGPDGRQLTWMDAKIGEEVVTPRDGKPVEIQALWCNALRAMERLSKAEGRTAYAEMAERAETSFAAFWNEEERCLYDRLTAEGPDGAIRPNQLLALSLPFPVLTGDRARLVLETVARELLTPYGLRTLSPRDERYRGRFDGDMGSRDRAYHQGTVWPWLMGPFVDACLAVHGVTPEAKAHCRRLLEPLLAHLHEAGLGTISEVFDGDPPHRPGGCTSQAWSVAEVLRAWEATRPAALHEEA